MAARFGNVLYWLGFGVAVICVAGAVLVALGTFPELPSALGYLKPVERLVVEISFPRADEDEKPLTFVARPKAAMSPSELDEKLSRYASLLCRKHGRKDCWNYDQIVWEAHPLGKLPTEPADIVAAYGYKLMGTEEERIWTEDYTRNLFVVGMVLVFALFSYGVGWVARYILRGRAK